MSNQITKIIIRNGTDSQRRTASSVEAGGVNVGVKFSLAEPAYCYDTQRLYIGNGEFGGLPVGMRNLGRVSRLFGTYLDSGFTEEAYSLLFSSGPEKGDIIFDANTRTIYSLSGRSNYNSNSIPLSSDFTKFDVSTLINSTQFYYDGNLLLNVNAQGIGRTELNSNIVDGITLFKTEGIAPLQVATGSLNTGVGVENLRYIKENSLILNNTNFANAPIEVTIEPGQVVGRTAGSILTGVYIQSMLLESSFTAGPGLIITPSSSTITFIFDPNFIQCGTSIYLNKDTSVFGVLSSILGVKTAGSLSAYGNENNYMSGNLGLGVLSPLHRLQVDGSIFTNNSISAIGPNANYLDGRLGLGRQRPTEKLDVDGNVKASGDYIGGGNITTVGTLTSTSTSNSYFAGNLGIGTNRPTEKLDVSGNVIIRNNLTTSGTLSSIGPAHNYIASRLGINTNRPTEQLHVVGNVLVSNNITAQANINADGVVNINGAGDNYFASNVDVMGNLGVGTVNPSERLHVIGNIQTSGIINSTGSSNNYFLGNIGINQLSPTEKLHVVGNILATGNLTSSNGILSISGGGNSTINANLGIGTASPTEKLHVVGNILATGDITSSSGLLTVNGSGNNTINGNLGIGTASPSQKLHVIGNILATGSITSSAGLLTISGAGNNTINGNLGIGTASPTEKLHVVGNLLVTGNTNTGSLNVGGNAVVGGNLNVTGDITSTSTGLLKNQASFGAARLATGSGIPLFRATHAMQLTTNVTGLPGGVTLSPTLNSGTTLAAGQVVTMNVTSVVTNVCISFGYKYV